MQKLVDHSYSLEYLMDQHVFETGFSQPTLAALEGGSIWDSGCQLYLRIYNDGDQWMEGILEDLRDLVVRDYDATH